MLACRARRIGGAPGAAWEVPPMRARPGRRNTPHARALGLPIVRSDPGERSRRVRSPLSDIGRAEDEREVHYSSEAPSGTGEHCTWDSPEIRMHGGRGRCTSPWRRSVRDARRRTKAGCGRMSRSGIRSLTAEGCPCGRGGGEPYEIVRDGRFSKSSADPSPNSEPAIDRAGRRRGGG